MSFIKADNRVLALIALIAAIGSLVFSLSTRTLINHKQVKVETINISRIVNAERASVSGIIKGKSPAVPPKAFVSQLRDAILAVSGHNTIVVVRQAIVAPKQSGLADITSRVMKKLGLPVTKAGMPTPLKHAGEHIGQTGFSNTKLYHKFNQRQESLAAKIMKQAKQDKEKNIAP